MNHISVSAALEWAYFAEDKLVNQLVVLTASSQFHDTLYERMSIWSFLVNLHSHNKWKTEAKNIEAQMRQIRIELDTHRRLLVIIKYHKFVRKDITMILPFWAYAKFCQFALNKNSARQDANEERF